MLPRLGALQDREDLDLEADGTAGKRVIEVDERLAGFECLHQARHARPVRARELDDLSGLNGCAVREGFGRKPLQQVAAMAAESLLGLQREGMRSAGFEADKALLERGCEFAAAKDEGGRVSAERRENHGMRGFGPASDRLWS